MFSQLIRAKQDSNAQLEYEENLFHNLHFTHLQTCPLSYHMSASAWLELVFLCFLRADHVRLCKRGSP